MRPVLLFVLFGIITSACEKKEVKLSQIDTFTGGMLREWLIAENFFSGVDVTQLEDCHSDDIAVFSKGDPGEDKLIPVYKWNKNEKRCSAIDEDLRLYFTLSGNTIIFGDQDMLTNGTGEIWDIDKAESSEIIISQNKGTSDERRLRFVPKPNS